MNPLLSIGVMKERLQDLEHEGLHLIDLHGLKEQVLKPAAIDDGNDDFGADWLDRFTIGVMIFAVLYFGGHLLWWWLG